MICVDTIDAHRRSPSCFYRRDVPPRLAAALAFSGNIPNEEVVDRKKGELMKLVRVNSLTAEEEPMLYQYHPPFAPGWMRLNEVVVYVRE